MPISRRTGRRYAAGSHAVYSEERWEPRECAYCGERVTLSGKTELAHLGAFFSFGPPARSFHNDCKRKHAARARRG